MITHRSRVFTTCLAVSFIISYVALFHDRLLWRAVTDDFLAKSQPWTPQQKPGVEIVVASTKQEDTSWLATYLPEWKTNIYVVNDWWARLRVPKNKGRESMVYLTYIIDHYDDLPENILFIHASRFAWHNDDPNYDAVPTLMRFQLPYLRQAGYVNLRCTWQVGCPAEIRPHEDAIKNDNVQVSAKAIYKQSFQELLPELPVPAVVSVSCCSQFGVTRETVRRRPREDYIRYRRWLIDTPLEDALSGRMLEFSWHIIFGKEAVHCPSAQDCYCKVYGLCDLNCWEGICPERYTLPQYANLPDGWPKLGWNGENRNYTESSALSAARYDL